MNFFKDKRVLVTGSAGFIGVNLTKKLVTLGAKVRGTIHKRESPNSIAGVEYVRADLRLIDDCYRVVKDIDYIFMAAANSSGAEVIEKTPLVHLTPNIVMNAQMLEAAYANKVKKFCFISSNTVYPVTEFPVKENDVNNEFFEKYYIVGWMKRFTEIMCDMYATRINNPMETIIVRPGNLYGPYDKFSIAESKVIAALIRRAVEREFPFKVWGDGTDIKDFLYIDDFIEALIISFEKMKKNDVINIASGKPITINEIVMLILELNNCKNVEVKFDTTMPTMIPKRLINIKKANELLNWSPKIDIKLGLKNTIEWYKSTYKNNI